MKLKNKIENLIIKMEFDTKKIHSKFQILQKVGTIYCCFVAFRNICTYIKSAIKGQLVEIFIDSRDLIL